MRGTEEVSVKARAVDENAGDGTDVSYEDLVCRCRRTLRLRRYVLTRPREDECCEKQSERC
jgi:hypothetical protein